jgi:hypothetical protein
VYSIEVHSALFHECRRRRRRRRRRRHWKTVEDVQCSRNLEIQNVGILQSGSQVWPEIHIKGYKHARTEAEGTKTTKSLSEVRPPQWRRRPRHQHHGRNQTRILLDELLLYRCGSRHRQTFLRWSKVSKLAPVYWPGALSQAIHRTLINTDCQLVTSEEHLHVTFSPAWILYTILHTENISSTDHTGSRVLILNLRPSPNKPYLTNALPILYEGHGNAK